MSTVLINDPSSAPGKSPHVLLAEISQALRGGKTDAAVELAKNALNVIPNLEKFRAIFGEAHRIDLLIPLIWEQRNTTLRQLDAVSVFLTLCYAEMPRPVYHRNPAVLIWNRARRKLSGIGSSLGLLRPPKRGDFYLRELRDWLLDEKTPPIAFSHLDLIRKFSHTKIPNEQRLRYLFSFKYKGWDASSPEKIARSLADLAARCEIPQPVLDFLYKNRSDWQVKYPKWLADVKSAQALLHVLKDASIAKVLAKGAVGKEKIFLTDFCASADPRHHVDIQRAKAFFDELDTSRGLLLCTFHASFANVLNWLLRRFLADHYAIRLEPRGGSREMVVRHGPRGAAFRALKTLMEKKVVIMAPDGPLYGDGSAVGIEVFGRVAQISSSAARIAYEAGSDTGWCSVMYRNGFFVPVYVRGPARRPGEKYEQFRDRWKSFYADQVESTLSSNPRSLVLLSHVWFSLISEAAEPVVREEKEHPTPAVDQST